MKTQTLLLIALLFLGLNNVQAEKKGPASEAINMNTCISGVILDKATGEALVGVEVELEGSDMKTFTDFDGKFAFDNVNPGKYKVSTSYVSYEKNQTPSVDVSQDEMHTFNLTLQTANK